MRIRRMQAVFGKLQNEVLELHDGLNIIQAPNETGKSTWCAFLLSMLYGISSRERDRAGFIADKNRYLPWSGSAMSGRIDCAAAGAELTLTRETRRAGAPMGDFKAVYSGTEEPVPGLAGTSSGETLLGVSREVYERSAFIRQAGLAITQDAGLERRIAALISSGEEGTSYSEASGLLKTQLNRRRHNRTGRIPETAAELEELRRQLAEAESLEEQLASLRSQAERLELLERALTEELAQHDRWEAAQKRRYLADAEAAAEAAALRAAELRRRIAEEEIPESDTIARLRGAVANLETVRSAAERSRAERDMALSALEQAEAAAAKSPLAGMSGEEAKAAAAAVPAVKPSMTPALAAGLAALAAALLCCTLLPARLPASLSWLSFLAAAVIIGLGGLAAWRLYRGAAARARSDALTARFGTDDPAEISGMADTYIILLKNRERARADADYTSRYAADRERDAAENEQGILQEVRRFAPAAFDIPAADALLRSCEARRRALAEAENDAENQQIRAETLRRQTPLLPEDVPEIEPPRRSREEAAAELESLRAQRTAMRAQTERLTGRLQTVGESALMRVEAENLEERLAALEEEYRAIQMAQEALDGANAILQSRFSPALGQRAAEIFSALTDGAYDAVALDRSFHLTAEPAGDAIRRDAALLSAGAADQLYLAVRLAICELVLPPENEAPIVLDDALANFDDARCAAALKWLKEEAAQRQILLFTCHSREADFFAGDEEVHILRLTAKEDAV